MPSRTIEIPLPGGLCAIVSSEDEAIVRGRSWYASRNLRGKGIVYASTMRRDGSVSMHRLILGLSDRQAHVDHRDGNGLNNTRENLRVCTRFENARNARLRIDNTTGFKGVGMNPRTGRYHARIFANGKSNYLGGRFSTAEEAHSSYRAAAERFFGKFARFE